MTYKIIQINGKAFVSQSNGDGSDSTFPPDADNRFAVAFRAWNAAQQTPLDLSDQGLPMPIDSDKDAILTLLDKDANGKITAAEKQDFVYRVCKRIAKGL